MPPKKERFEDCLKQVEEAVRALESGKLGLDESMERYTEGVAALKQCHQLLEQAELKIKSLVEQKDGTLVEKEFSDEEPTPKKSPRSSP